MCAAGNSEFPLSRYLIAGVPLSAYYIPNFISVSQEEELIENIYAAPKPKWTSLSGRRLQNWGGYPHAKGMIPEQIPLWLNRHIQLITVTHLFNDKTPNHVLINEYLPGQGIMAHSDGPVYSPIVANLSLLSHTIMNFYEPISDPSKDTDLAKRYKFSFLLEPRSLLCLQQDMYIGMLHGIEGRLSDEIRCENIKNIEVTDGTTLVRGKRVSLTLRHVEKILKFKLRL